MDGAAARPREGPWSLAEATWTLRCVYDDDDDDDGKGYLYLEQTRGGGND